MAPIIIQKVFDNLQDQTDEWFHHGDYLRSVQAYRMAIAYDPDDFQSYFLGAWLLWSAEQNDESRKMFLEAVRTHPNSYEPYMELGFHWSGRRDYKQAALWLFHACRLGAPVEAWKTLAHSYEKLGELETALRVMQYAREIDPYDPAIPKNIQWLKDDIQKKKDGQ